MRSLVFAVAALLSMPVSWARAADATTSLGTIELQPNLRNESLDLVDGVGRVKLLRVVAKNGSVVIRRVTLVQHDGKSWAEARDINLRRGERTRQIVFAESSGGAARITFEYDVAGASKPVTIEVLADIEGGRLPERAAHAKPSPRRYWQRRYYRPNDRPPTSGPLERMGDAPDAGDTDCIKQATCTPINIFFGTNRAKTTNTDSVAFSQERADELTLGRVVVTVPRAYRKTGEIPRPSWKDVFNLSNPWSEDPTRHFVLMGSSMHLFASADAYVEDVRQKMKEAGESGEHVFIFIHGFNTSFEFAAYRAAQISFDLGTGDRGFGTAMLFSWPSAGETEDYVYDLDSSRLAVAHLKTYIGLVTEKLAPKHVHLIAHSMGNWPLLFALDEIGRDAPAGAPKIDSVILAAPDVDAKEFQTFVSNAKNTSKSFTLYASSTDRALIASKKLRRDMPRAGDVTRGRPVLADGLDSLDVSDLSTAIFSLNHSEYADKKELLNDMSALMQRGTRPPDVRNPSFHSEGVLPSVFWRFVR